jgi:sugar lactone lactonase YvrE
MKTKGMLRMTATAVAIICGRLEAQDVFVSDFRANSIYYFTPDGVRNTFATGLDGPGGIAFDKTGNLFVVDTYSGNIYKYTPNGVRSTFASGLSSSRVWGIAFDQAGNLYGAADGVGTPGSGRVFKWTASGQLSTFAAGLYAPRVLAFDSADNLYVSNFGERPAVFTDTILRFTLDGTLSTFASGLFNTTGMAFDSAGNLFVQDSYAGSSIYEITPTGVRSTFAPVYGVGLGFDSAGNLLQGEDSGDIYEFSPEGTRTLFASGLERPAFFAVQVPEPSVWAIICVGSSVFLGGVRFRHRNFES